MIRQSGISLSEVLISLFLTSIIMTAITQFYLNSKRHYLETQQILENNFELQWISDLLSDSIRRAGFTPCMGVGHLNAVDRRDEGKMPVAIRLLNQGIQINRMSEYFAVIRDIASPTRIAVPPTHHLHEHRPVIIADCEHAEVHHVATVAQAQITLSKPLNFSYTAPVYIGEWLEEQWYIKPNKAGSPTLHYHLVQTEELSPLIHSLTPSKQGRLIQLIMGLDREQTRTLKVVVRGS